MTTAELIEKLQNMDPDGSMQVIVPSDDGRRLGFDPKLTAVVKDGQLGRFPWFKRGLNGDGERMILIDLGDS